MYVRALAMLVAVAVSLPLVMAKPVAAGQDDIWPDIRENLFGDQAMKDNNSLVRLRLPDRIYSAALVPISIKVQPYGQRAKKVTLVIDHNPAPLAAEFEIGPGMGQWLELSTRVRVHTFSHIRAIVELEDGTLHHVARYIKAAGGCQAAGAADPAEIAATMGKFKVKNGGIKAGGPDVLRREARMMVRHPNASGFQTDPKTGELIPTEFVDSVTIHQGGRHVLTMHGTISISEDPSLRFTYRPEGEGDLEIEATDTAGRYFSNGSYSVKKAS